MTQRPFLNFTLLVKASDTTEDVKANIQDKVGIPPHWQRLHIIGPDGHRLLNMVLEDGVDMWDYLIRDEMTLELTPPHGW